MKKLLLSLVALFGFTTAFAGTGTEADPYTVAEIIAKGADASEKGVYVKGFIVGSCTGKDYASATFTADGASATNVLLADEATVADASLCIPVQLPSGAVRTALQLSSNPKNLGRGVTLGGDIAKYFGQPGFKNTKSYVWADGGGTDTPDTPDTPAGPVSFIDEDFASSLPSDWTQVNISGDKAWYHSSYGGVGYAAMTGYKGTQPPFDQWLVTPAVDMSKVADKSLSFRTQVNGYGSTTSIFEVYVMTAADAKGTNTKLEPAIAVAPASGYSEWVESGKLDLSAYTGTIYIGFRFYATEDANYATWCVTDVKLGTATDTPDVPDTPVVETVANVAEFIAKATESNCPTVAISGETTVVYKNGRYMWVKDATAPLLVYNLKDAELPAYKTGDVIPGGITGEATNYSQGQIQMSNLTATSFAAATSTATVEATAIAVEEIAADRVNEYVVLENVSIAAGSSANNYTVTDATGSITLYNQFNNAQYYDVVEMKEGEGLKLYAIVAVYKGNAQLYPVKIEGVGSETPDTPDVPDTPVIPDDPNVAVFKAPQYSEIEGVKLINNNGLEEMLDTSNDGKDESKSLTGTTFEDKGVSLVFTHGTGDYYTIAHKDIVRWYANEIATITAPEGATITKVFVQTATGSKGAFTAEIGKVEGEGKGADTPITWTGSTSEPLVLIAAKQVRFSYIAVTFEGGAGVENIEIENAPAVYYNLQGVEVANPENGIYVRVQGGKASKVVIR